MGLPSTSPHQIDGYIIMFDIDSTITSYGQPLKSKTVKDLISIYREYGCKFAINTNRPISYPFELTCRRGYIFDAYYGNTTSWNYIPYLGCLRDWLYATEFRSKIHNMKQAKDEFMKTPILLDDNLKTVMKVREAGFLAVHVGVYGIDESVLINIARLVF